MSRTDPPALSDRPLPGQRRLQRDPGRPRRLLAALNRLTHDLRLWSALTALMLMVLVLARLEATRAGVSVPDALVVGSVLTSTVAQAVWLTVRVSGSPFLGGGLALLVGGSALLTREPVLLVGAAVAVSTVAAVLALLATAPAARFRGAARELMVAVLVAVVGALTAAGYDAPVDQVRAYFLVVAFALLGTFGVVYKLGAGFHGLGRRGVVTVIAGTVLLFVVLAYARALTAYGSEDLREALVALMTDVRGLLGAVPRPGQFLLGFPALVWGVSQRARRRQGWWVCAFGAVGLAGVTTRLLDPGLGLGEAALGLGYNIVIGLALGYLAIRVDAFLVGNRGRRARRAEEAQAHRPEPPRLAPLL